MASAWWNLGLRFMLELAALAGLGVAGWRTVPAPWNWLAVIALPLGAAALWGVFNVPDDPSRSGAAPVPVPGLLRLLIEFVVLFGGVAAFALAEYRTAAIVLAVLIAAHYALSWDRIAWLLAR
ncbi:MAG: YrdB family protein [Rhizobiaceae bacterium]|nr:YrdB family protein [Rhizobiaceae bacterium]